MCVPANYIQQQCIRFRFSVNVPSNLWNWCGASGTLSPISAMRVLAAIFIAAVYPRCSHAHRVHRPLTAPLQNFIDCSWTLGPAKCFNALGAWRAERAIDADAPNTAHNLIQDMKRFPWNQYRNSSEEQLNLQLCDGTEKLLRRQSLSLTMIPGYRFELLSKGNGTINVEVYKSKCRLRH